MDILASLKDFSHVLLLALGGFAYLKWTEKRKELRSDMEAERAAHKEQIEETIKAALHNGISDKMRSLLADHEKVETANMERVLQKHTEEWHLTPRRRRR